MVLSWSDLSLKQVLDVGVRGKHERPGKSGRRARLSTFRLRLSNSAKMHPAKGRVSAGASASEVARLRLGRGPIDQLSMDWA